MEDMKAEVEIMNLLTKHGECYQTQPKRTQLAIFAGKLTGYPVSVVKQTLDKMADNAGRFFPTLEEIKQVANGFYNPSKARSEQEDKKLQGQIKNQQDRMNRILGWLREKFSDEEIQKYYERWCEMAFGDAGLARASDYGLESKTFMKLALYDLEDAKGKINVAIEIGRKRIAAHRPPSPPQLRIVSVNDDPETWESV